MLLHLSTTLSGANAQAQRDGEDALLAVGLAYIQFAIDKPAFFRAMWSEETIYSEDPRYVAAYETLSVNLKGGFAESITDTDPESFSSEELLAWSSVHGLANLFVDGPVGRGQTRDQKLMLAGEIISTLIPVFKVQLSNAI